MISNILKNPYQMYCFKVTYPFEDAVSRDELSAPPTVDLQSVAQVRVQELQQEQIEHCSGYNIIVLCTTCQTLR